MNLGGQTVTFVSYVDTGVTSAVGARQKAETLTEVPGCHHRPLTFTEAPEHEINVATETWKTTAPPSPVVLAAKAGDVIRVNGVTFHLIGGGQPHADLSRRPFKVTFTSRRYTG